MHHDPSRRDSEPKGFWRSRHAIGLLIMGAIAAYFLLNEHRAHLFAALPFLLLLACPLLHLFMHRGHGGHGGGHADHPDHQLASKPTAPAPASKTGEQP